MPELVTITTFHPQSLVSYVSLLALTRMCCSSSNEDAFAHATRLNNYWNKNRVAERQS